MTKKGDDMGNYKFKGLDMSGHWVFGLLTKKKIRNSGRLSYAIATDDCSNANTVPISESSICQFTGHLDKNGNEIYFNDIIEWNDGYYTFVGVVIWRPLDSSIQIDCDKKHFPFAKGNNIFNLRQTELKHIRVIDNIFTHGGGFHG